LLPAHDILTNCDRKCEESRGKRLSRERNMLQIFALLALIVAWWGTANPVSAQETRTQAPCSPVVDRTAGNVTLTFNGGCTVGISPAELQDIIAKVLARQTIPPELMDRYDKLREAFGVTDTALANFFRILGENKVPTEQLDAKLRQIAAQHVTLLRQAQSSTDDDPRVAAIKRDAVTAVKAGDYPRAKELLQRAFNADLAVARQVQEAANKRYLTAAKTKADLGELELAQLHYAVAAQDFQEAADLVPGSEPLTRASYLNGVGLAALNAANFPLAGTALAKALSIREKLLDPDHRDVAVSLNNLALLLKETNRPSEAEPLYRRALAIEEKSYGPNHPDVARDLNNLALLLQDTNRLSEAEPLLRRALAIDEKSYGPDHPHTKLVQENLRFLQGLLKHEHVVPAKAPAH
jgi:tetratricopeptide (TPR) repeat protein